VLGGDHRRQHRYDEPRQHERRDEGPCGADREAPGGPVEALRAPGARHPAPEEGVGQEVESGASHDDGYLRGRQDLRGVRDHELVPDGGDDDAGDHDDVEVGVAVSGERGAVLGELQLPLRDPGDVVEVQPPHRRRRDEGRHERRERRRVEVEVGGGRPGDDDGLAERDDDKELEALREVLRPHVPHGARQAPEPRHPVDDQRRPVVQQERGQPEGHPRRSLRQGAEDPQHAGRNEPDQDAPGALALDRPPPPRDEREKRVPSDLNRHVGGGEEERPPLESLRYRDRHQEAQEHQGDHQQPHGDGLRV
jgi:hypothetical protein